MSQTAIVTGASSGLGFEIAAMLRERGMTVIGVSRRGPGIRGDASKRETAIAARDAAGDPALLVNCAGVGIFHPAGSYTPEEVEEVIGANLVAMINFCEVFAGRVPTIGNVMSTAALSGKPGESVYCAAKWGARGYTEALRAELKETRVVGVYPGGMKTPFWASDPERAATFMDPKDIAAKIVAAIFDSDATEVVLRRS